MEMVTSLFLSFIVWISSEAFSTDLILTEWCDIGYGLSGSLLRAENSPSNIACSTRCLQTTSCMAVTFCADIQQCKIYANTTSDCVALDCGQQYQVMASGTAFTSNHGNAGGDGFQAVFATDSDGRVVNGNKEQLASKLQQGAELKIIFKTSEGKHYAVAADEIEIDQETSNVCVRVLRKYDTSGYIDEAARLFFYICTDGNAWAQRWKLESHLTDLLATVNAEVSWFIRESAYTGNAFLCEVDHTGLVKAGSTKDLVEAISNGTQVYVSYADDRTIESYGTATMFISGWRDPATAHVCTHHLWHSGGNYLDYDIRDWAINQHCTVGWTDSMLWYFGASNYYNHGFANFNVSWTGVGVWRKVFEIDEETISFGTLENLMKEIETGHKLRVLIEHDMALAGVTWLVHNGKLFLQPEIDFANAGGTFDDPVYRKAYLITTGYGDVQYYPDTGMIYDIPNIVAWFADDKNWRLALQTTGGVAVNGTKNNLVSALKAGADLVCYIQESSALDTYIVPDSVQFFDGNECEAESIRTMKLTLTPDDRLRLHSDRHIVFTRINTTGVVVREFWSENEGKITQVNITTPDVIRWFVAD